MRVLMLSYPIRSFCFITGLNYYPKHNIGWDMKNKTGIMKGISTNLSDVQAAYSSNNFEQNFITLKRLEATPPGKRDINIVVMFSATINTYVKLIMWC